MGTSLLKGFKTFHGRDIFAPVAAYLANGVEASKLGEMASRTVKPSFAEPTLLGGQIIGEVLHIDDFGNVITNISTTFLRKIKASEGKGRRA
jgi:S-adenosylmethionine hydrolase